MICVSKNNTLRVLKVLLNYKRLFSSVYRTNLFVYTHSGVFIFFNMKKLLYQAVVVGGMEQQGGGEHKEKPTQSPLEAFPPLGVGNT